MQVILQEKIKNLGTIGDIVSVKPGYARNFLYRTGKALPANKVNVDRVTAMRGKLEKIESERLAVAKQRVLVIEKLKNVTITVPTNEEGRLFGSVGATEIIAALAKRGIIVSKQEVSILEVPVRAIGLYTIEVQLHADATAHLPLVLDSSTVPDLLAKKQAAEEAATTSVNQTTTSASSEHSLETAQNSEQSLSNGDT